MRSSADIHSAVQVPLPGLAAAIAFLIMPQLMSVASTHLTTALVCNTSDPDRSESVKSLGRSCP
jgi:hypothetical protein